MTNIIWQFIGAACGSFLIGYFVAPWACRKRIDEIIRTHYDDIYARGVGDGARSAAATSAKIIQATGCCPTCGKVVP